MQEFYVITPEQRTVSPIEGWMRTRRLYWVSQVGSWGGMALLNIAEEQIKRYLKHRTT